MTRQHATLGLIPLSRTINTQLTRAQVAILVMVGLDIGSKTTITLRSKPRLIVL